MRVCVCVCVSVCVWVRDPRKHYLHARCRCGVCVARHEPTYRWERLRGAVFRGNRPALPVRASPDVVEHHVGLVGLQVEAAAAEQVPLEQARVA